jgi:hypothetical protein
MKGYEPSPAVRRRRILGGGICSVDPSTVPKIIDTIPSPGITQDSELDPTHGPVVIHGLTVP